MMGHKNIFITGRPGVGKTTLIHSLFKQLQKYQIAGFYTREIREKGTREGFLISTFDGHQQTMAHKEFTFSPRIGKYSVNLSALEEIITILTIRKLPPDVWLIDEIGKMESLSIQFQQFVEKILSEAVPVLATISEAAGGWIGQIREQTAAQLFEITEQNRDILPLTISRLLEEIIHETKGRSI